MPTLTYKKIYGAFKAADSNAKGGIYFTDDTNVLFPAGANLVTYDSDNHQQSVIARAQEDFGFIQAVAISADRRWLAVAAKSIHATLTVYDLTIGRKRRTLTIQPDFKTSVRPISFRSLSIIDGHNYNRNGLMFHFRWTGNSW
jgi:hypothetical protein